jgi:hypothetical protein
VHHPGVIPFRADVQQTLTIGDIAVSNSLTRQTSIAATPRQAARPSTAIPTSIFASLQAGTTMPTARGRTLMRAGA